MIMKTRILVITKSPLKACTSFGYAISFYSVHTYFDFSAKFYSPESSKKTDRLESTFSVSAVYPPVLAVLKETLSVDQKWVQCQYVLCHLTANANFLFLALTKRHRRK